MLNRHLVKSFICEPMVVFVIVALSLFVADIYVAKSDVPSSLLLTPELTDTIILIETAKRERILTEVEHLEVLKTYVEHELFFLDALASNTHRDFTFYNQIIRKHQALLTADMPMPTSAEVESYYQNNPTEFSSIKVWHVDFIYDETDTLEEFRKTVQQGQSTTNHAAVINRLDIQVESHFGISSAQASYLFSSEVATRLEAAEPNSWIGPYSTLKGPVLVKVISMTPSQLRPFNKVKDYVLNSVLKQQKKRLLNKHLFSLKMQYGIEEE